LQYIASYSPVDNVRKQAYAPILLEAGLNDSRVAYWEAAKFAQVGVIAGKLPFIAAIIGLLRVVHPACTAILHGMGCLLRCI
jgi:hypothetical protein